MINGRLDVGKQRRRRAQWLPSGRFPQITINITAADALERNRKQSINPIFYHHLFQTQGLGVEVDCDLEMSLDPNRETNNHRQS